MSVRAARSDDVDWLTRIWYDGWHEAHAALMPAAITQVRTLESFRDRIHAALPNVRVFEKAGAPVGFCILKDDELYQLFVAASARGSGAAAALVADAEARIRESGARSAWLACAVGNERAARFYEKSGWQRTGMVVYQAEVPGGYYPVEVWRYEKVLVFNGNTDDI